VNTLRAAVPPAPGAFCLQKFFRVSSQLHLEPCYHWCYLATIGPSWRKGISIIFCDGVDGYNMENTFGCVQSAA
jgi:hypothetical protein